MSSNGFPIISHGFPIIFHSFSRGFPLFWGTLKRSAHVRILSPPAKALDMAALVQALVALGRWLGSGYFWLVNGDKLR